MHIALHLPGWPTCKIWHSDIPPSRKQKHREKPRRKQKTSICQPSRTKKYRGRLPAPVKIYIYIIYRLQHLEHRCSNKNSFSWQVASTQIASPTKGDAGCKPWHFILHFICHPTSTQNAHSTCQLIIQPPYVYIYIHVNSHPPVDRIWKVQKGTHWNGNMFDNPKFYLLQDDKQMPGIPSPGDSHIGQESFRATWWLIPLSRLYPWL